MSDCYCDFDVTPEFFTQKKVKARKPHTCCECFAEIEKGSTYTYTAGKWESEFSDFHTCELCFDLSRRCDFACCPFGMMIDNASEVEPDMEVTAFINRRQRNFKRVKK